MTITGGPDAGLFFVWDGVALLTHNPRDEPRYLRVEHPSKEEIPGPRLFFRPGTDAFEQICPGARRLGTKTVFGRVAVRYACDKVVPTGDVPVEEMDAREIALDEQTGLMLVNGPYVPTEVTFGPAITADTFSTKVPPGGDQIGPDRLDSFRVPAVSGGHVTDASYRGKPFVIVIGPASGIRSALGRLLPMTSRGTEPPVVGLLVAVPSSTWNGSLLNPADEKAFVDSVSSTAGRFAVSVGIDIKGSASQSITVGIPEMQPGQPGFENRVAIALVRSDGTLGPVTLADKATDAQLRNWLAGLS